MSEESIVEKMKKHKGCFIAALGAVFMGLVLLVMLCWGVSVSNQEARLRNTITAKQTDNTSQYDAMWKKIDQSAQVTEAQKDALKDIFVSYAQARNDGKSEQLLVKWVHESVPNADLSTYKQLMNIITSSRDSFAFRQKELLDLKREHDNLLSVFPGSAVLSMLGRKSIDVTIVTSSKTEKVFQTGKDDDTDVFHKKEPAEKQ